MTTRRLMLIGRSHCITLPKELVKELKLKEGEELYIDLAGNVVIVGRVDTMMGKEPIGSICRLLADAVKMRVKLDKEMEKYARGETDVFELASNVEEIRKCLQEIGFSIKQLLDKKIQPLKTKFDFKFMAPKLSANELLAGIEDLTMQAYTDALDALCSEVEYMVEKRRVLNNLLKKINEAPKRYDKHTLKGLETIRITCMSKLTIVDEACRRIKKLIENVP